MRRFFSALLTAISLIFITMSCSGNLSEVEILEHSIKQDHAKSIFSKPPPLKTVSHS